MKEQHQRAPLARVRRASMERAAIHLHPFPWGVAGNIAGDVDGLVYDRLPQGTANVGPEAYRKRQPQVCRVSVLLTWIVEKANDAYSTGSEARTG